MAGEGPEIGHAHVGVSADNDELRRDIAETEAMMREQFARMDKLRARPEVEAETAQVHRELAAVRLAMAELDRLHADPEVDLDDDTFNRKMALLNRKVGELNQRKIILGAETRQLNDADRSLRRVGGSLNDVEAASDRVTRSMRSQEVQVAKLRDRYGSLQRQARTLAAEKTFPTQEDNLRLARMHSEMSQLETQIRTLGGSVRDIDVDVDRHNRTLGNWARSVANIRLHLGFMSLTIVQFLRAVTLLGPVIEGLAGSTIALAGSLGAGVLGAAGVGAAGLTAFGITAIGLVAAVKPAFEELGNLRSGFEAAREAAIKYGKDSTEFETAQKNLNQLIKNSSPEVVRLARSTNQLGAQWQKLTGPAQRDFFGLAAEGIEGLQGMLPMLGRNLNATMAVARQGAEQWIRTFTGPEAQAKINNLLSNFRSSLPSVMRGLEHLGVAFLNTLSEISNHFTDLGRGFEAWASDIRSFTEGAGFGETVDGWIKSLQQWGHLLQATGRLIVTFFGQGREAGDGLAKSLTNTFNQWSDWMQSVEGRNSLADFFQRSSDMARQFFSTVGPILEILFELAQITAPITQGILAMVRAVANLVTAFTDLGPVKDILQAIGVGIAAAFVVGRITAFVGALRGLLATLGLVRAATAATAATGIGAGIAAQMGGATAATKGLSGGLAGLLSRINPVTAGLVALGTGAYILHNAMEDRDARLQAIQDTLGQTNKYLEDSIYLEDDLVEAYGRQAEAIRERDRAMGQLLPSIQKAREATDTLKDSEQAYHQAVERFGPRSQEAYNALYQKRQDQARAASAERKSLADLSEAWNAQDEAVGAARETLGEANEKYRENKDVVEQLGPVLAASARASGAQAESLRAAADAQGDAEAELKEAMNARATAAVNITRSMAGLAPITKGATQAVGEFTRAFKGVPAARKLLIQTNSRQAVGDLAAVGNQARNLTSKNRVVKILADSDSAQEAIVRLQNLIQRVVNRKWEATLGIIDRVSSPLTKLASNIMGWSRDKYQATLEANGGPAATALAAVIRGGQSWAGQSFQAAFTASVQSVFGALGSAVQAGLSWAGRVFTATFNVNRSNFKGGITGGIPGFAQGADERMIRKATREADQRAPKRAAFGGEYTKPTYLVGEEREREYVIATNPAYRDQNERYLASAANEFGYALIKATQFAKGGKTGRGPLFGPRSEYENLRHQIDLSESTFSNMQRHYEEQLALGVRYPLPSLDDLAGQKQGSIDWVDRLMEHVQSNVLTRLARQKDTLSKRIKRLEKRTRGRKPKSEKARNRWERDKQDLQDLKQKRTDIQDRVPELRRELDDLGQERYGYELDLASLLRGDVGAGGGAAGPTLEEQFATFNQARLDMFRTFGGNFNPLGAAFGSGGAGFSAAGTGGTGATSLAMSPPPPVINQAGPTNTDSSKTVIQNINMEQPDDPHLFTQALEWEANAGA